jgi:hypothetical protein
MAPGEKPKGNNDTPLDLTPLIDELAIVAKTLGVIALRFSPVYRKTERDKIYFLEDLGFDNNGIANILAITTPTVNARLWERHSTEKKGNKKGKKKHGKDKR